MPGHVILSHGSDAGPDATKVSVLARLAQARGWTAERPDYRDEDAHGHARSVTARTTRLVRCMDACAAPAVLAGSSMGAFVSALASLERPVAALFLMATPASIPSFEQVLDLRRDVPTLLIHGWNDEVCPLDDIYAFARRRALPLLVLDGDHRLSGQLDALGTQFSLFLDTLAMPA